MTIEPSESVRVHAGSLPTGRSSREYRAAVALTLGATITLAFVLLYGGVLSGAPPIRGVVVLSGVVLGMLAMFSVALALAAGRGWAIAVATPMLELLVIAGVIQVLAALALGSIDIPFNALLAYWALRAPVRAAPLPAGGPRAWRAPGTTAFIALVLSVTAPLLTAPLLSSGGPLIVAGDALRPSLVVVCDSVPGRSPTAVQVSYSWEWARAEPLAAGTDIVEVRWYTAREDGLSGYGLGEVDAMSAGIHEADVRIGEQPGFVFAVDLAITGFGPAAITVSPATPQALPSGHGAIEFAATYVHAPAGIDSQGPALWRVFKQARCEW